MAVPTRSITMASFMLILSALVPGSVATTLYNGLQSQMLSSDLSTSCDAAFNTSISCPENTIQYVTYGIQAVDWNTTLMTDLCTSDCVSSLEDLWTAIDDGCGDATINVGGTNVTFPDWIDHIQYKMGLICLADEDTGDFCLDVERTWNITEMVLADEATWPDNTYKCYFDAQSSSWDYITYRNGTCISNFDFEWVDATDDANNTALAALDYYMERPDPINDDNYGWALPLEFDEYPLEIQCSSCFLQTFQYGLENRWGDVWDNITAQIWENMKLNCGLDYTITPANDFSNAIAYGTEMNDTETVVSYCPQNITISSDQNLTCLNASIQYEIPTAGIYNLNTGLYCPELGDVTLCAPLSCPITVVSLGENLDSTNNTENIANWVAGYSNFTLTQFYSWNPYIGLDHVTDGTTVCVGPPGGVYVPPSATVAVPSVYTTTAVPESPTPSGTIANCGLYYTVEEGDYCDLVCEKFSLTFSEFIDLNPSIDSACSNLILGDDYCVAAVNGTTVSTVTSTRTPTSTAGTTTSTSKTSSSSTSTASYVAAPSPTVSGTTPYCYEWYTVATGDSCYTIEQAYNITLDEFIALNTYIDSACDNLWAGYSYCVSGIPLASTSSSTATVTATSTSTATSVTTPTPTQTGMASGCTVFYEAQSGDGCYDIAAEYGITLDEFYEWNPAVGDDCSGLWPDYYYCVGM